MINHQFKFTLLQRETHSGILRIALARLVGDAIRLSTPFGSQRHSALNAIRLKKNISDCIRTLHAVIIRGTSAQT